MNKMRICFLLAALLLIVLLPWHFATAENSTSGSLSDTVTWELKDGTLTIAGEGKMEGMSNSRYPAWYYLREEITKVVVEDGILNVGGKAFKDCINLKEVRLPFTVVEIGAQSFMNCRSLEQITIPSKVTTIGNSAFEDCAGLKSFTMPNNVKDIGTSVFEGCVSLETVTISNKLKRIEQGTFRRCTSLKEVSLPKSVTKIGSSAFCNCTSLTEVEIKGKLTYADNFAFQYCESLVSLEFPSSLEWIGSYVFQGCRSLMELRFNGDMPDMSGYDVFDLGGHHDGSRCTLYYPVNNKTWTQEKMDRFARSLYIRFEPYGTPECDHKEVTVPGKDATCTEKGLTEGKYCSVCEKVLKKQEEIDALGHNLVTTTVPPTCTEPGYELHQCSRCEHSETDNPVEATGHGFGEWETVKEATVEETGLSRRVCTACGETEEQEIEKLTPPPTKPPTEPPAQPPTEPTATALPETTPVPTQPDAPAPQERAEAGLWILLILFAVIGAIAAVKILTKKKI